MGDAHPRSHRRSLIVSSTTATDIKQNIEGQELSTGNTTSSISDSVTATSADSPTTMYGPTMAVLPQVHQYPQHHMSYMSSATQPRYHHAPMQSHPAQQAFNMQALQNSLQSYQLQGPHHNQQPRYGPVMPHPSVQYSVTPIQIPTVATQAGQVHGIPQYPQTGYYEAYSQSPPSGSHNMPMAGYTATYPGQPTGAETAGQYPQWSQGSMPFLYLPQYGQQTGMIPAPMAPMDYNYGPSQQPSGYVPRNA
ncbi:hypothetical protein ABW20_dc0109785 [Dactylellina cionopaga]|nr:hypothetical protein ABW20_dc0109785 [Dactylellina cionopaga]